MLKFDAYADYSERLRQKLQGGLPKINNTIKKFEAGKLAPMEARREILDCVTRTEHLIAVGIYFGTKAKGFDNRDGLVQFDSREFFERYHSVLILEGRRLIEEGDYINEDYLRSRTMGIRHVYMTKLGFGVVKKLYMPDRETPVSSVPVAPRT